MHPYPQVYKYLEVGNGRDEDDVLESNIILEEDFSMFIARNEAEDNYILFDSFENFKNWFATSPYQPSDFTVVTKFQAQPLRIDVDVKIADIGMIRKIQSPAKPVHNENGGLFGSFFNQQHEKALAKYEVLSAEYESLNITQHKYARVTRAVECAIAKTYKQFFREVLSREDVVRSDASDDAHLSSSFVLKHVRAGNAAEARMFMNQVVKNTPAGYRKFINVDICNSVQTSPLPECCQAVTQCAATSDDMIIAQTGHLTGACELVDSNIVAEPTSIPFEFTDARELTADECDELIQLLCKPKEKIKKTIKSINVSEDNVDDMLLENITLDRAVGGTMRSDNEADELWSQFNAADTFLEGTMRSDDINCALAADVPPIRFKDRGKYRVGRFV